MNTLSKERKKQILSALVEGNSIRSIERMTGTHRDTIMRLLVRIGKGCEQLQNENCRDFHSNQIQVDEIWTYVGKKERQLSIEEKSNPHIGDQYVFVALDAETKLVPVFKIGKRDMHTTFQFIAELKKRLNGNGRIQLSSDGFNTYPDAIAMIFRRDIDYAQIIKLYTTEHSGRGRYSPPKVSEVVSKVINGNPDPKNISTSYVERQNLTMRMQMRRFTRLTNAFSKKLENLKASVALHFAHYNFMRIHSTLQVTPAMEAGITNHLWGWEDILAYEVN